jgi:hypothetical protein
VPSVGVQIKSPKHSCSEKYYERAENGLQCAFRKTLGEVQS